MVQPTNLEGAQTCCPSLDPVSLASLSCFSALFWALPPVSIARQRF
jgi:hypothetical protein